MISFIICINFLYYLPYRTCRSRQRTRLVYFLSFPLTLDSDFPSHSLLFVSRWKRSPWLSHLGWSNCIYKSLGRSNRGLFYCLYFICCCKLRIEEYDLDIICFKLFISHELAEATILSDFDHFRPWRGPTGSTVFPSFSYSGILFVSDRFSQ